MSTPTPERNAHDAAHFAEQPVTGPAGAEPTGDERLAEERERAAKAKAAAEEDIVLDIDLDDVAEAFGTGNSRRPLSEADAQAPG